MFDDALPYDSWRETKETLHRYAQLVGKLRLAYSVRRNHWWNVPFHLTASGITTRPMGASPTFAVDVDFVDHRLTVASTDGRRAAFALGGSVAHFHEEFVRALTAVGVDAASIREATPFDLPDATRRFADDDEHASYDRDAVSTYFRMLSDANLVLEEFCGRFSGKTSPVHHFWHTFDIAATRFSDVVVDPAPGTDGVTREAYSREVVSSGFWFGDDSVPEPAFYSYTAPEPAGIADAALPTGAQWLDRGASHLAVYPLAAAAATGDARRAALAFFEAAYRAGAERAGWDIDRYACVDGITDPVSAAGTGA
ncbi:DUF5996 family protein [Microbacterium sp. NPDC091313]